MLRYKIELTGIAISKTVLEVSDAGKLAWLHTSVKPDEYESCANSMETDPRGASGSVTSFLQVTF